MDLDIDDLPLEPLAGVGSSPSGVQDNVGHDNSPASGTGTENIPRRGRTRKQLDFAAAIQQASNAQADLQRGLPSDVGDSSSSVQFMSPIPMYPPPILPRQHAQLPPPISQANRSEEPTLRGPPVGHPLIETPPSSQISDEPTGGPDVLIDRNPRRKRKIQDLATAIYEASACDPTFEFELSSRDTIDNIPDSLILDPSLRVADNHTITPPVSRADDDYGLNLQNIAVDGNGGLGQICNLAPGVGDLEALLADIVQYLPNDNGAVPDVAFDQINQPEVQPALSMPFNLVGEIQEDMNTPDFIGPFNQPLKGAHLFVHVCDECGKTFDRPSNLERHARTHSGETPFKCDEPGCAKAFKQRSALTIHRRRHTNEKPFACEFPDCGVRFSESSGLARHRRAHTGRRPWRCERPDCAMSFTRQSGLASHTKTHEAGELPKAAQPGGANVNPEPSIIKKRKPKKKAEDFPTVKTAAQIEVERAIVEQGYQLWDRARAGPGGMPSLPSDATRVVPQDSPSPPPPVTTLADQHIPPTPPPPLDSQVERESGTDLNAVSPSEEDANFSRSPGLRRVGRKRKRPQSPTESVIQIDEYEWELSAATGRTARLSVQQVSPPIPRKRGRPRNIKLAEIRALDNNSVTTRHTTSPTPPPLVSRNSKAPSPSSTLQPDSEPLRFRAPETVEPALLDEIEEEEEEEEEEAEEIEEGEERSGSTPIHEDSVPRLPLLGSARLSTRAGSVGSSDREEPSLLVQGTQLRVLPPSPEQKGSSPRPKKKPSKKNSDKSNNPKNRKIVARSKELRPRRSADMIQSSRKSTPSTAGLVRAVRAKKKELTARPSFFVDSSKPQVPSYSDDDEIYSEDEEEEEDGKELQEVERQRQPMSKPSELEAWAMDESVQEWIG